jgi:hypothetical protein
VRPPQMLTVRVQASFFAGISSIYLCMAFDKAAHLMSIVVMASHGRQVFKLFLSVVCVVKRFEDGLLDNSDLSFLVKRAF